MMRRTVLGFCTLAVVLAATSLGVAQTVTAKLSGVLTDESGAVLPGAKVSIKNVETGVERTAVSGDRGQFVVPQLPPGSYEVTVTLQGFETLVERGITLAVGDETNLKLKMNVGAVTSSVEVTGEMPVVNTSNSAVSGVVEEKRIVDLPLNGRDFSQLALVQPGVIAVRNTGTFSDASKGAGTRISMAGSRMDQTSWLLDGTNIRQQNSYGTPGSAAGVMMGVDAVQEFRVLVSNYSAEFGNTSGGVVNMVTKSGTNRIHGSAYEFLRNSDLDARSFFDVAKPAFKRNQFGFSLGGPIKKDKAFFFGNYEGLRQRLGVTKVSMVPDENVRKGLIPTDSGGLQQVRVAPEIQPYLNIWPHANGPNLGGGVATNFASANQPTDENYFVTRGDYHLSDNQNLFARFTFDQASDSRPDLVPITSRVISTRTRFATLQYERIFTPQLLSTTRLAYNRSQIITNVALNIAYPANLFIFDKGFPPQLLTPDFTDFGPNDTSIFGNVQNLYEFSQNFVYTRGPHLFKFGFDFQHVGFNANGGPRDNGTFSWASTEDFLLDNPLDAFSAQAPGSTVQRSFTQRVFGFYIQDDWKVRPNFTLNLGLRYEPFSTPEEKWGRVSVVKDWVHATAFDTNVPFWQNPSKKNFSPRVGFSWDPTGDGKTAVRGGFGIFFMDLLGAQYRLPSTTNPPFVAFIGSPLGNLASAVSDVARVGPTLLTAKMTPDSYMEITQYDLKPSYEMKANLTIERQLPGNTSLTAGYLGGRGIHLWRQSDANDAPATIVDGRPFVARGTPRVNPNTGVGTTRYSDAQSFYNALQVELKKRFSHGLTLQSSYTWSKLIDDATSGNVATDYGDGPTPNPDAPKSDRGLSYLNISRNLVVNGIYAFPSPARSAVASHLLGGWQLSSVFTVSSGAPFTALVSGRSAPNQSVDPGRQHADLVAGRSFSSLILGGPDRYFDPTGFALPPAGFYGNAGRNILIGPGFADLDASLMKSTPLGFREGARLEFRADFFNLANHANFAVPSRSAIAVFNAGTRRPNPSAGRITQLVSTARQLQFSLKLIF